MCKTGGRIRKFSVWVYVMRAGEANWDGGHMCLLCTCTAWHKAGSRCGHRYWYLSYKWEYFYIRKYTCKYRSRRNKFLMLPPRRKFAHERQ